MATDIIFVYSFFNCLRFEKRGIFHGYIKNYNNLQKDFYGGNGHRGILSGFLSEGQWLKIGKEQIEIESVVEIVQNSTFKMTAYESEVKISKWLTLHKSNPFN